jgi:KaiC/GvpD/RAD55 family RecA-like ATPase
MDRDALNLDRWRLDLALLDEPATPPDYLVDGFAERGSVILLTGDAGTAKSFIACDLCIAVVQARPWLGRKVKRGRALYVGAENSKRLTVRRLRALGLRGSDTALRYVCRAPLVLSDLAHRSLIREEVEAHEPDVLVLDSALSLAGIDPNDNAAVAEFMAWVRQLAEDRDLVVIVLHHESKSQVSTGRSTAAAAKAALGAMSWRGQADLHIAVELPREPRERGTTPGGDPCDRWRVTLKLPKEREFGETEGDESVVVESVKRGGVLVSMEVRREGASNPKRQPSKAQEAREAVAALLIERGGRATRAELREALSDVATRTLDRVLGEDDNGLWTQPKAGVYEAV